VLVSFGREWSHDVQFDLFYQRDDIKIDGIFEQTFFDFGEQANLPFD